MVKKSKKLIWISAAAAVLIIAAVVSLSLWMRDKSRINGWFLRSDSGIPMIISEQSGAITLGSADDSRFEGYSDGDEITVICGMILETYPAQTDVYFCFRTSKGSFSDIPENELETLRELDWIS